MMTDRLEQRVAEWVRTRIGEIYMQPKERAMRLLEEAIELAQAEGITQEQVAAQAAHVFSRPEGDVFQEAGGVAVCLLAWCAARKVTFEQVAIAEIERIEKKRPEDIRGSLARKADADIVVVVDPKLPPGTVEFRYGSEVVGRIVNLAEDQNG